MAPQNEEALINEASVIVTLDPLECLYNGDSQEYVPFTTIFLIMVQNGTHF
jgi:hypothetical protein